MFVWIKKMLFWHRRRKTFSISWNLFAQNPKCWNSSLFVIKRYVRSFLWSTLVQVWRYCRRNFNLSTKGRVSAPTCINDSRFRNFENIFFSSKQSPGHKGCKVVNPCNLFSPKTKGKILLKILKVRKNVFSFFRICFVSECSPSDTQKTVMAAQAKSFQQ